MDVTWTTDAQPLDKIDFLGIVVFEDELGGGRALTPGAADQTWDNLLRPTISDQRFKGKIGQTLVLDVQGSGTARRLGLVGAGPRASFRLADYRHAAAVLARLASVAGARSLLVWDDTRGPPPGDSPRAAARPADRLSALAQGALLGGYRFEKYLGVERRTPATLETIAIQVDPALTRSDAEAAVERGRRVAAAAAFARDLINEPAGSLTPTALAREIAARAATLPLEITILDRQACRSRGMGMFLAVAQGSNEEPKFIHVAWRPPGATRRVVLVGKGVTFDSGGLSLKTTEGMLDMKSDMAGAAAVLAAILAVAEEKLPVEVHALAACTENMPSGSAYKLGDVLRSMSGKTVEINNTDAEGRLTLADALTYGLELQPDVVLDFATLTGACVVALGPHTAGVMSNDAPAVDAWLAAAREAGEDMWQLPLPTRLLEQLKSDIADMKNTGERWGGALTAGLFLKEFVGATPWIHVDLAGPATAAKEWGCLAKGGTGFGVATILEYLRTVGATAGR